jgi:cellulose synthase/poly-beta-1,6-N-acetylglucosamine synthase-like glycosyltransferase
MMPCYKEGRVIPDLIKNISNLDYPIDKLQVMVLVEDNDWETREALAKVNVPAHFEIFTIPTPLNPKGKPAACNIALKAVKTDYLVIYDAEDRPEPSQLKKAVKRFKELPENVVCLQGKLNWFNHKETWLTKFFTIEYTTWFDFFILGLSRLGLPIPLGGTTNHIKVKELKAIGGWDEYNVTEDCDLGIRLAAEGYKVDYLESTTLEEAPLTAKAWIKQRTRWTKGYMVTWLVHMRSPIKLYKMVGLKGMLALQLFVLGTPLVNLINPIMFGLLLTYLIANPAWLVSLFPLPIWYMGISLLTLGNLIFILISAYAVSRLKLYYLLPWCFMLPFYWLLQSIATFRALEQLIFNPHVWEKTEHGLSKVSSNN